MADDGPTPGELSRRLDRIDKNLDSGFVKLENRLDKMVTAEVFQQAQQAQQREAAELRDQIGSLETRRVNEDCNLRSLVGDVETSLRGSINGVEQQRAADRRALTKAGIAAAVAVITLLLGAILPLLLT